MGLLDDRLVPKAAPPPPPPAVDPRTSTDGEFSEFLIAAVDNDQGSLEPSNLRTTTDSSFGTPIAP